MKANIVIADGYTDAEFLVAYHYLKAWQWDVEVYSLNGGPVKGIQGWVHKISTAIHDGFSDSDMLVLVGGVKAMEYLRQSKHLILWIQRVNDRRDIIASICHGSQTLIEADVIRGRKVLGYYSIRRDIENAAGIWPEGNEVYTDGNLVTATHYDYSGIWIKTAVDLWTSRASS